MAGLFTSSNATPGGYNSGAGNSNLTGAGGGAGPAANGNFLTALGTLFGVGGPGTSSASQLQNAGYQTNPNLSTAQQWQNQQQMLAQLQAQQATGNGPSAAAAMLNAGTAQAVAQQNAGSAGQRYGQNAAQAAYQNAGNAAGIEGNAANNAAAAKAGSMIQAQQGLGQTAAQGTEGALGMQSAIQAAQNPVANLYGQEQKQSSNFGQSVFTGVTNAAGGALGLGSSGGNPAAAAPIAGAARGGVMMAGGGIADGWQGDDDAPPPPMFSGSKKSAPSAPSNPGTPVGSPADSSLDTVSPSAESAVDSGAALLAAHGGILHRIAQLMARGGVSGHDDRVYLGEKAPEVVAPVDGKGGAKLVTHPSLVHMGQKPQVVVPLKPGSAPYRPGPLPSKVGPPPSTPAPRHIAIDPKAAAALAGKRAPASPQRAVSPLSPRNAPVVRQALARGGVQVPRQIDVLMGHVRRLHAENQALKARVG